MILTALTAMIFSTSVYTAEQKLSVSLNGENVSFSNAQPIIVNGRTLIPLRGLFEKSPLTIFKSL